MTANPQGPVRVVPLEPDFDMLQAGCDAAWPGGEIVYSDDFTTPEDMLEAAYKAMLAAAPSPAAPEGVEGSNADLAVELLRIALLREYEWHDCRWDLAMDEARECSHRAEKGAEADALRHAKTHDVRMRHIQGALTALKTLQGSPPPVPLADGGR